MQYALMIYPGTAGADSFTDDELASIRGEYLALIDTPQYVAGAQLQPTDTATTVQVSNGKTLMTDGPFADTKEVFGGVMILEAANLDEAVEFASRIPAARLGGAVEIRPVVPR